MEEYAEIGNKKVAYSAFELITHDAEGQRIVRKTETNIGNLISDALRIGLGADIAYFNSGAIRSNIEAGEITYNDLLNVLPFNNTGVVVKVSGEAILEMLEVAMVKWPEENACFPNVSGMTFSVNTQGGEQDKVYNVKILNSESGIYEALELDRMYTIASSNFILLECGDGMTMFEGAEVVSDTGILDIEVLEKYLAEKLGGVIDESYAEADCRITFTEGVVKNDVDADDDVNFDVNTDDYSDDGNYTIWIVGAAGVLAVAVAVTVLLVRRKRKEN
jgi:2',3'-cyclic-nucleotide 2'-phosphodiesterase (5'-nucleotidase family)